MNNRNIFLLFGLGIILILGYFSFFTVLQTRQALVLQFGNPKEIVQQAGLHFKLPWRTVQYLDKRILNLDVPKQELIASDQKRMVVDAIARFRITKPLLTYQRVRTEDGARQQLTTILVSTMRQVLGRQAFATLLSGERADLMKQIRDNANTQSQNYGIEIVDVRLRRVDLPEQNSEPIYNRMKTEREREAREARAEGREQSQRIRAQADREVTVLLAEADRDADIIRGQGDGQAVKIFADAFGQDEDFYEFYRSMEAYKNSMGNDDTTLVLSPDSEFFKFFEAIQPKGGGR